VKMTAPGPAPGGTDLRRHEPGLRPQRVSHGGLRSERALLRRRRRVLCNGAGTDFAPYDNCRAANFCDASARRPRCAGPTCAPGLRRLPGRAPGDVQCDGSGYTSVGSTAAPRQGMRAHGSCASVALDKLGAGGSAVPSAGAQFISSCFRVSRHRSLVQLDAAVQPNIAGSVTWVVYAPPMSSAPTRSSNQTTTSGTVTAGYVSSGASTSPSRQGAYYLLGVAVKGAHGATVLEGNAPSPVKLRQMLAVLPTMPAPSRRSKPAAGEYWATWRRCGLARADCSAVGTCQ